MLLSRDMLLKEGPSRRHSLRCEQERSQRRRSVMLGRLVVPEGGQGMLCAPLCSSVLQASPAPDLRPAIQGHMRLVAAGRVALCGFHCCSVWAAAGELDAHWRRTVEAQCL